MARFPRSTMRNNGKRRHILFWSGLAAATALLVADCGGPTPSGTVKLSSPEIAILTGAVNPNTTATIGNALQQLTQLCMKSKGLVYYPALVTAANANPNAGRDEVGVPGAHIGLAARETSGFGFRSEAIQAKIGPTGGNGVQSEEAYADSLRGAVGSHYRLALNGSETSRISVQLPGGGTTTIQAGGCTGAAERHLYESVANFVQAETGLALLRNLLYSAVTSDSRFTAVVARWSSCMSSRGFHYRSPTQMWNTVSVRVFRNPTPAAGRLEIRVAVADYRCARAMGLVAIARRLQSEHAKVLSRPLARYLALITAVDARAARVARGLSFAGQ